MRSLIPEEKQVLLDIDQMLNRIGGSKPFMQEYRADIGAEWREGYGLAVWASATLLHPYREEAMPVAFSPNLHDISSSFLPTRKYAVPPVLVGLPALDTVLDKNIRHVAEWLDQLIVDAFAFWSETRKVKELIQYWQTNHSDALSALRQVAYHMRIEVRWSSEYERRKGSVYIQSMRQALTAYEKLIENGLVSVKATSDHTADVTLSDLGRHAVQLMKETGKEGGEA